MPKKKKHTPSLLISGTNKQAAQPQLNKTESACLIPPPKESLPLVPIVAFGASAGGLETLQAIFSFILSNKALAFVSITHLSPTHSSLLPELLQKKTKLKVWQITNDMKVEAGCIYVIPPNKNVIIKQGILKLVKHKTAANILPIDQFFQTLAEEQGRKMVGVILSGNGKDGTQGIHALSAAGGLIIAQDPKTAKYDSMPASAIDTGLVDYILAPDKMAEYIFKYLSYNCIAISEKEILSELQPIYHLLHMHIGHDFSLYKHNTICRRIEKRMSIHQINNISAYTLYLQQNQNEIHILFKDLLIGVTHFFRNPEAFKSLQQTLLIKLLKVKPKNEEIRVWVPACATGEEAYSIAILLQECMEELQAHFNVQIFGTDINEAAIEAARRGVYPSSIIADVSEQRLKRFFIKEEGLYRIHKDIRKMVVFASHNISRDPPFTKLDLLSCRNLLIYFTTELQRKLLPLFQYSLNYNGILFLGPSENISSFSDLFSVIDSKWKIFQRKEGFSSFQEPIDFNAGVRVKKPSALNRAASVQKSTGPKLAYVVETILLEEYAPACIVLDEKENIVYIHGRTSKYLEPANGPVNLHISHMVRPGLKQKISAALCAVTSQKKPICYKDFQVKDNGSSYYINLKIRPFYELDTTEKWKLLIFEDVIPHEVNTKTNIKHSSQNKLAQQISFLEEELKLSKENLQITIEELETSNEELTSSNEELQSTNEELQSTNEELETSKEELQSLNEELTTLNSELEAHIKELYSANDDIQNLLHSTEIATIFLDNELHIKRFTPKATELTNLIQTDIGRPITDIVSRLKYDALTEDASQVLKSLAVKTREVQNKENQWFQVRIMPYRTLTNIIDGVVITFLNITAQKQVEEKAKQFNETMQEMNNYITLLMNRV